MIFRSLPPLTVLIVDDSPENLQIAGETLSELECELSFALDGASALRSIAEEPPDLILLDIMMPGLDGLEVCRQVKADPRSAKIPVIFFTAKVEPEDLVVGFEAGGSDYVTKPFHRPELLARVKTHLQLKRFSNLNEAKNEELNRLLQVLCHDLANPIGSIDGLLKFCASNPETLQELLPEMSEVSGRVLTQIKLVGEMHQLREGAYRLQLIAFPVREAMQSAEMNLSKMYRDKDLILELITPADLEVRVEPISFINTVLTNLLSNAAKFSFRGGKVTVRVDRERDGVRLDVIDQGQGIAAERLPDLFVPTAAISTRGTEEELGTGFGLAQVKSFTEAYGGWVKVESRHKDAYPIDHGTTVSLFLKEA